MTAINRLKIRPSAPLLCIQNSRTLSDNCGTWPLAIRRLEDKPLTHDLEAVYNSKSTRNGLTYCDNRLAHKYYEVAIHHFDPSPLFASPTDANSWYRSNMADQFEWVHMSSIKTVPYQVRIKKGEHLTSPRSGDDMKVEIAAKPTVHEKSVHVDWVVSDETWKEAPQHVKDLGISRYKLYEPPTPANRRQPPPGTQETEALAATTYHILEFTTTKGNTFSFHDRNGDLYDYPAFSDGDHAIRYRAVPGNAGIIGVI